MTCYLCGSANPTTRDHVPPKGFFPDPKPSNLITLPCCDGCNRSFSLDDDAMRVWLSAGLGHSESAEWIIQNKVFPGTLARSPAFRTEILNSMEQAIIANEDGQQIDAVKFDIDRERVERFIIRVTKGLLRHHYPSHDYTQDHWDAIYIGQKLADLDQIKPLLNKLPNYDFRGDAVIQYRHGFAAEGLTGIWLLLFYGTALFVVTHRKGEPLFR